MHRATIIERRLAALVVGCALIVGAGSFARARADTVQPASPAARIPSAAGVIRSPGAAVSPSAATAVTRSPAAAAAAAAKPSTAAVASMRSRLKIGSAALASRNLHVKLPSEATTTRVTDANANQALVPKAVFAERLQKPVTAVTVGGTKALRLPIHFNHVLDDLSLRASDAYVRVFQPLSFDLGSDAFVGRIGLGVLDAKHPNARDALTPPVSFTVTGAGDISPRQIEIRHLNQPFQEVTLRDAEVPDKVTVEVLSTIATEAVPVELKVVRPKLRVVVSPSDGIDGLGLQTATISVEAAGGSRYAGRKLMIQTTKGRLQTTDSGGGTHIVLDESGAADATLRSASVGTALISVSGYPFATATASINFALPILFLGVAVLGAVLGSIVRKNKKSRWYAAVIWGLLGAVLVSLGINFLALSVNLFYGSGAVFVGALLAAYMGSGLTQMILGGRESAAS
jgi:hypothetical protein